MVLFEKYEIAPGYRACRSLRSHRRSRLLPVGERLFKKWIPHFLDDLIYL
ncbi:MAG: hypothetical protein ACLSAF_23325 [Intestinimonas sp.]